MITDLRAAWMRLAFREVYFAFRQRLYDVCVPFLDVCRHKLPGFALKGLRRQSAIPEARIESDGFEPAAGMLRDQGFEVNRPIGDGRNHAIVRGIAPYIAHPPGAGNMLLFAKLRSFQQILTVAEAGNSTSAPWSSKPCACSRVVLSIEKLLP